MKPASTLFLRIVVWAFGLVILGLCLVPLPILIQSPYVGGYRLVLLGMYVTAVPFYIALYQTLRLLHLIDHRQAFSSAAIHALQIIKRSAAVISLMYSASLPYLYRLADSDDAPGVMLLGLIGTFGPLAIAVFAGVLQRLFRDAITIKSEHELTI